MKHLFLSVTILAARPISTAAQVKGGWTYDSTKDEMTDEVRFLISTNSRPIYNDRGGLTIGMIGWRCSAITGREVLIVMDRYFGGNVDNQVIVETRLDSARSDSGWWSLSANKQGAFMPTEDISNFTSHVETSRRLLVRVTDLWMVKPSPISSTSSVSVAPIGGSNRNARKKKPERLKSSLLLLGGRLTRLLAHREKFVASDTKSAFG